MSLNYFEQKKLDYKNAILRELDTGESTFESVKRECADDIPESYGLWLFRLTKPDLQKLLRGDILYHDSEYTIAIGMAEEDINEV